MKGPRLSWAEYERRVTQQAARAAQNERETPPVDMPPDFAVIRSVGAIRRWGDALWRWDGKRWHLLVELSGVAS